MIKNKMKYDEHNSSQIAYVIIYNFLRCIMMLIITW